MKKTELTVSVLMLRLNLANRDQSVSNYWSC